ncbi:nicotinate-nucleotide adenylyltransferase [Legionella fairfieldensis]|uniref:nicotinate-nucleotide adenylyltransferase n=1 Tax=Legionella fairfieldensis TaxID=45064 RepID=UPI0004919026|nr:nicotinate-nucleotide adenylyltransferase [Legionella fairfieldensis]
MHNFIIYGGTFDPIHNGHINTAINIQNHFNFDRFVFLPCKVPVLKHRALATAKQRITMIELALSEQDKNRHFTIDLSEINRDSPSYMVNTLENFRQQFGNNIAIVLIMGADTFNQLPQWHAWQQILSLTNLLVIKRPGKNYDREAPEPVKELLSHYETHEDKAISQQPHGLIYRYNAGNFNVSSSWIRQQIRIHNEQALKNYLSDKVLKYIKQNNLYLETH